MKKFLVLGILTFFVLGTAGVMPAQALEVKFSGMFQTITYVLGNYSFNQNAPVADKDQKFTSSFADMRFRPDFNFEVTKDLKAIMKLEMDSTNWGDNGDGRNNIGRLNADRAAVEVRNMYLDWNLPRMPVNLKVGLYGNYYRMHVFNYTDAMSANLTINAGPISINPYYYKGYEGAYDKQDDIDYYGLNLNYTGQALKAGIYGLYVYTGDFNAGSRPAFSYPYPGRYAGFDAIRKGDFYWAGVYADGGMGNLLFRFDAIGNWGKLETRNAPDIDYQGWMAYGKVWLDFKTYQVGLVGMYSTGDDLKETTKVDGFRLPPGSESYAVFQEGLIVYPGFNALNGYMTFSLDAYNYQPYRGYGGTYLIKPFVSVKPVDWLLLTGQYQYIGDTVKNGNRFGTASDKDLIGQEVDLFAKFTITKNLTYDVAFGYLFSGDALKRNDSVDPENAWAFITRLLLLF